MLNIKFKMSDVHRGFSLVEVMLAVAIFSLIVSVFVGALIYAQQSVASFGSHAKASFLAEEGLEAARNIRDAGFSNLTDGTYGLAISGGQWVFFGSSDTTDNFTRTITISTIDPERKQVSSNVFWQENPQRTGSVALITYLDNWAAVAASDYDTACALCCKARQYSGGNYYSGGICRKNQNYCQDNGEIKVGNCSKHCPPHVCCCRP
jgi:prepilin-type N-terminal cleavage/methylation domain-containing protein